MYYHSLAGQTIGRWTVLSVNDHGADKKTKMLCRCECGTMRAVNAYSLKHRLTLSCGKCKQITSEGDHMRCTMKNGASFIFDIEDMEVVQSHTWSVARGHVRTTIDGRSVYLHQLLLGRSRDREIDHINGDKMDNRRCNLRPVTHAQNNQNKGLRRDSTTGYKGVCFDKRSGKYLAYINANGKRTYLGLFDDKLSAAYAYDTAALQLHGEYARPNLMKEENYDSKILAVG